MSSVWVEAHSQDQLFERQVSQVHGKFQSHERPVKPRRYKTVRDPWGQGDLAWEIRYWRARFESWQRDRRMRAAKRAAA